MSALTVVICTHDRAALLARTLDALDAARRPGSPVQVLVIANACSDGTHALLDARAASGHGRLPLRWLAEPRKGKSNALNTAMREVDTALVTFVDDDQRAEADFLVALCEAAQEYPGADLLCGQLVPDWDGNEPRWVHDEGAYRIYPLPVPTFELGPLPRWLDAEGPIPSGGNFAVRAEVLRRVGAFSTALGPVGHDLGGSEDSEWLLRALRGGARLLYVPGAVQRHYVDPERLTLPFLLKLTYKRTASTIGLFDGEGTEQGSGVPLWALRKVLGYAGQVLVSPGSARRRFYLMRLAAACGELMGSRVAQQRGAAQPSAQAHTSDTETHGRP